MIGTKVRSARLVDLPGVAATLQDAFSDKMKIIFNRDPSKVQALLEASYTGPVQRGYDGILVAEQDGRIIGTLVIEPIYYTTREARNFENLAIRELGLLRMLWTSFMLWLVAHAAEPARRTSATFACSEHQARHRPCRRTRGEMGDRARAPAPHAVGRRPERARDPHYEKAGFQQTRSRSISPC